MKLEKLTRDNFPMIAEKKIYCFEKSESYLKELCDAFAISDKIIFVLDENRRNHGEISACGRTFKVKSPEVLSEAAGQEAVIIITSDYYREAFDKICRWKDVQKSVCAVYYFANYETEIEEQYRRQYEKDDLQNIIVFRSGPHASSYVKGMDFADNSRALFEYMLREGVNHKYELIWFVKKPEEFSRYKDVKNVTFLSFDWSVSHVQEERDAYYRALCLSKYIFFTDAYGFARNCREDQVRVQLWHGCGFKARVNPVRCEKRYEYNTVTSDLYAKIHSEIFGIREEQLIVTGLAKEDWVLHPVEKERFHGLGIPEAKKYVFWLPTFRTTEKKLSQLNEYQLNSGTGLPVLKNEEQLREVNEILKENDTILLIKLHPFQNREDIKCAGYEQIVLIDNHQLVECDIQVNQLMGWTDGLISDYSSAVIDYLLLDRPVSFVLEDMDAYGGSRGFVYDNLQEWLPGVEIYTYEDFVGFIRNVIRGEDLGREKRRQISQKMHRFVDDQNSRRITEVLKIQ